MRGWTKKLLLTSEEWTHDKTKCIVAPVYRAMGTYWGLFTPGEKREVCGWPYPKPMGLILKEAESVIRGLAARWV